MSTLTACRWSAIGFAGGDPGTPAPRAPGGPGSGTHEEFVGAVRDLSAARLPEGEERARVLAAKLVYGAGAGYYRGICYYKAWENGTLVEFVEIAASGEESPVQLAGTTVHELGHVLAGQCGHDAEWKRACARLGLIHAEGSGQVYDPGHFHTDLWREIERVPWPGDGTPKFGVAGGLPFLGLPTFRARPCPMGRGVRGGKFGPGSGSRLRLWTCACPVKVRVASDEFQAKCLVCGIEFKRAESARKGKVNA